jgi:hypothetical protein
VSTVHARSPAISADGSVDPFLAASILKIVQSCYQVDATDTIQEIEAFIEEKIRSTDTNYKVAEAIVWADNFAIEQDFQKFRSTKGDFPTMVSTALAALASSRLSKERVMLLRPNNPELARMLLIAEGMTVPKPTGFVPNGSLYDRYRKHSKAYLDAAAAVDNMLFAVHEEQLGFILPSEMVVTIPGIHYGEPSWTDKKDKKCGRGLNNMTNCKGLSFNTNETKEEVRRLWGDIVHPLIDDDFVMIILEFRTLIQASEPGGRIWSSEKWT